MRFKVISPHKFSHVVGEQRTVVTLWLGMVPRFWETIDTPVKTRHTPWCLPDFPKFCPVC
jgi:hypothetical protein